MFWNCAASRGSRVFEQPAARRRSDVAGAATHKSGEDRAGRQRAAQTVHSYPGQRGIRDTNPRSDLQIASRAGTL
jgi:hypothetical protein